MNKKGSSPFGHYMIGIAALFLAGFFLLVVFGAQSYRDTVSGQQDSMSARALSAYLATRNMNEGYLVTFDFSKDKKVTEPQWIEWNNKRLFEVII